MKLKVKTVIRVAPHSYTVLFNALLPLDDERIGQVNRRTQTIEIAPHLPLTQQEVTFWHEILHEIDHNFSLRLSDEVVDNLAVGLVQFLQDNFDIELDFSEIKMKKEA